MADTLISTTFVYVKDSTSVSVGGVTSTTPTPTSGQISAATTALTSLSTGIDSLITERGDIYFVAPSFFTARGWSAGGDAAWGYTPHKNMHFINNTLGPNAIGYTVIHELFHQVDPDQLTSAKKATLMALMISPATGWWSGTYLNEAGECFADTAVRAYSSNTAITGKLKGSSYPGGYYYQRHIADSDFATFRSTIGGAGTVYSTTLAAAITAGATNAKVTSVANVSANDWIQVDTGANLEDVQVTAVGTVGSGGTGLTVSPALGLSHANSVAVVATGDPSVGGGGSIDQVVTASTASGSDAATTFTNLTAGQAGTVIVRFYDGTAWGPYSDPVAVLIPASGLPTQLTVTPATLTPNLGASWVNRIGFYSIGVYQFLLGVRQFNMLVEKVPVDGEPYRISVPFTNNVGPALQWGQLYALEVSLWPPVGLGTVQTAYVFLNFTPTIDNGPLLTYGGNPVDLTNKIQTLTPTFRITPRAGGNDDEAQLRLWNDTGTSILYDTGVFGFAAAAYRDVVIPANILAWGQNIMVSALDRASGADSLGAESSKQPAHVNAQPGAPYPVSIVNAGQQTVRRADGVWVTTNDTPTIVFPYRDADIDLGYTDPATWKQVELRNMAGAHVGSSPYTITSGIIDGWAVPTAILVIDTTYQARASYKDTAAVQSALSVYLQLRNTHYPVISAVAPAADAVVTDPTPTFTWTYASASGKVQAGYWLRLRVGGAVVYDSGFHATAAAAALRVPDFILDTAQSVSYDLFVYDTDLAAAPLDPADPTQIGLYASAFGTFTTSFTVPAQIANLVLTPDLTNDALVVAWDASVDPNFESYIVRYRIGGAGYVQYLGAINAPAANSLTLYPAAHNAETLVRVTQFNGWRESDPTDGSATLGGDWNTTDYIPGYWFVRADGVVNVRYTSHGQGDTQTDLERFNPPQRGETVLLNWGTRGYEATLSIQTRDRAMLLLLRSWKEQSIVSIFKTWYGAVRYVRLTATPDTDQHAALIVGQVSYVAIKPTMDF